MNTLLLERIQLARFSTGRRLSAYNQLRPLLDARGLTELVAHVDVAIAHDREVQAVENRWAGNRRRGFYDSEMRTIDDRADRALSDIRDICAAQGADLEPDDPVAAAAQQVVATCFPAGVAAVTRLPVVDQAAAMETILGQLQGPLAAAVDVLGLARKRALLAEIVTEYRAAVDNLPRPLDFATVRSARLLGQLYLHELVARVLGTFWNSRDPAQVAARAELLAPVLVQDDAVRSRNRARRLGRPAADPDDALLDKDDLATDPASGMPGSPLADAAETDDTGAPFAAADSAPDAHRNAPA